MKTLELNSKGNFDRWDQSWLKELDNINKGEACSNNTIFQDECTKLSLFELAPYERIPFRIIENDFNLICPTGGLAITRYSHGGIWLINFEKEEILTHNLKDSIMTNDLQNIGEDLLIIAIIEYKKAFVEDILSSKYVLNLPDIAYK